MKGKRPKGPWWMGLLLLLAACAPRPAVEVRPVPGVKVTVPVSAPKPQGATAVESGKKAGLPAIKVLPGNPLPEPGTAFADDFSTYPTGAVLPVVAPDRYGLLRQGNWQKVSVTEAFDPSGRLDKAVRLEGGYGEGFLTTGSPDWTDYRVSMRIKVQEACCTDSHLRARLFLDGAGGRALEFQLGFEGAKLVKLAGDQAFVLVDRPELRDVGRAFLRDGNWHDLVFELKGDGAVRAVLDGTELLVWKDPDYRQGGFGIGPKAITFFLDDLKIERLGTAGPPSEGTAPPSRADFCGLRAGEELPHERFLASGEVELFLLGGATAARDYRIGYYPAEKPEAVTYLIEHRGAFEPATCLNPPPSARFRPEGPFGLAHTYEHYGTKTAYSEDARNEAPKGFRAYRALNQKGEEVGILLLIEDWIDADYDDVGLLLRSAESER